MDLVNNDDKIKSLVSQSREDFLKGIFKVLKESSRRVVIKKKKNSPNPEPKFNFEFPLAKEVQQSINSLSQIYLKEYYTALTPRFILQLNSAYITYHIIKAMRNICNNSPITFPYSLEYSLEDPSTLLPESIAYYDDLQASDGYAPINADLYDLNIGVPDA